MGRKILKKNQEMSNLSHLCENALGDHACVKANNFTKTCLAYSQH